MRFSITTITILLLAMMNFCSATPVPAKMFEIEKRWAAGDSEQQIHAGLSHRDMTPAWPVARDMHDEAFASATDERSLEVAEKRQVDFTGRMRDFAARTFLGPRTSSEDTVAIAAGYSRVLRPRKGMRYDLTGRE